MAPHLLDQKVWPRSDGARTSRKVSSKTTMSLVPEFDLLLARWASRSRVDRLLQGARSCGDAKLWLW